MGISTAPSTLLTLTLATLLAAGCSGGSHGAVDSGPSHDASSSCGSADQDGDGVPDGCDQCPDTPAGAPVNTKGCADSQTTPKLETTFPPYGLTWTTTGDAGRAGGTTWTYTGIQRADLFHIWWIVCDDTTNVCGLSLDGPVDRPSENWVYSAAASDLANGKLVLTNATHILLADGTLQPLSGRLTLTLTDANQAAIPFASVATLGVNARAGGFGAEIPGTGFQLVLLAEVSPDSTTWTPYLDYADAAPTPPIDAGPGNSVIQFNGSFYDK